MFYFFMIFGSMTVKIHVTLIKHFLVIYIKVSSLCNTFFFLQHFLWSCYFCFTILFYYYSLTINCNCFVIVIVNYTCFFNAQDNDSNDNQLYKSLLVQKCIYNICIKINFEKINKSIWTEFHLFRNQVIFFRIINNDLQKNKLKISKQIR